MGDPGGIGTASMDGFQVESNVSSSKELGESLRATKDPEEAKEDASKAASELGKRGGEASAKKRAEAKPEPEKKAIKPIPDKPEKEAKAEGEEKPEAKETEEEPEKKDRRGDPRHDPVARMKEATRKEAEAKRDRDAAFSRVETLEARLAALERGEKPAEKPEGKPSHSAADPSDPEPDEGNYEDYKAFLRDFIKWEYRQEDKTKQQKAATSRMDQAFGDHLGKLGKAFTDAGVELSEEGIGSFKTSFQIPQGQQPTAENWIADEFVSDIASAPKLWMHFQGHPDELQRLATLTNPRAATREMAMIVARLDAANSGDSTEPEQTTSKAPPPVTPVKGAPYVDDGAVYKSGMEFDTYRKRADKVWPIRR